jgi:hypothetical protein
MAKPKFKATTWRDYYKSLINRGSVTFWLENDLVAETAMYRVRQLFSGYLTLRDYDGQVTEALAMVRALNKMTKAGMPESVRII